MPGWFGNFFSEKCPRVAEKPLRNTSAVQMEFCQIAFQPPLPLWELFLPKIGKFVKTAVLTLGMDILTMTMVKLCSKMVYHLMDHMMDNGEIWCKLSALVMGYIH